MDLKGVRSRTPGTRLEGDLQGREMDILEEHFVFIRGAAELRSDDLLQRLLRLFQIGGHAHRQRCCGARLRRTKRRAVERATRR